MTSRAEQLEKRETYREQLARLAQALAAAKNDLVRDDLAAGTDVGTVKMFTNGNLDKRFEKLQRQVEFVAGVFENLDDLLEAFIRGTSLAAYDTGASDGERFLQWLETTRDPTPEQRDYIICQRARHAVEDMARTNRVGHIHFQELLSMAGDLAAELETNPTLRVHLNPIRVWARFETKVLLDEEATVPADVLFFPIGSDIRTAVLEQAGGERIRELAAFGPITLSDWHRELTPFVETEHVSRGELGEVTRMLIDLGLAALG